MDIFLVDMMVVFVCAVIFGIMFRFFKLPSLVGQVLAGFTIGMWGVLGTQSVEVMKLFSTLGVTLLLFLVGLEMNWQDIRHSGKTVFKLFFTQTVLLASLYLVFSTWVLRLGLIPSVMLAIALTFSSTILVVKTLSEGKDLNSFVGKLSLGMLLLQDLLAIILLALIPSLKDGFDLSTLTTLLLKIGIILLTVNVFGHVLITWMMKKIIKSSEDLILFSLVWFFVAVYFSTKILNLSPEIGGILAGLSLSTSWGNYQIVSKVRTLRDIFLTVFFVLLGFEVGVGEVNWLLVGELVGISIIGKFAITVLSGWWCGLKKRTAFSVSINMTQISEFSLIIMSIGLGSLFWDNELVAAVTVAGLITMILSTVLMSGSARIYKSLVKLFPNRFNLERGKGEGSSLKGHIVLLGGDRTGRSIMSFLKKNGEMVLVVDFNPEVISRLKNKGEAAIFADASDPDVVEITNMREAKMVISTVKDVNDTLALLTEMKLRGIKIPTIVDAESASQASGLYKAGASYVIFPHFVSGLHLGQLMKKFEQDSSVLSHYREKQNDVLKEIYDGEF